MGRQAGPPSRRLDNPMAAGREGGSRYLLGLSAPGKLVLCAVRLEQLVAAAPPPGYAEKLRPGAKPRTIGTTGLVVIRFLLGLS